MWTIFKIFIGFVTVLLLFYALVFLATRYMGSLAPQPGIKPTPPHWKAQPLTLDHQGSPLIAIC